MKYLKLLVLLPLLFLSCKNQSKITTHHKLKNQKKSYEKVLFVVTSHDKWNTGENWFLDRRIGAPYYELLDQGIEITIATPRTTSNWSKSEDPSAATEDTKRFDKDAELQSKLKIH
jgi:hypothetical protein